MEAELVTHKSWRIDVTGRVQGVGFRPFIYRLANKMQLQGSVRNSGSGVEIIYVASPETSREFCSRIQSECPSKTKIHSIKQNPIASYENFDGFNIINSESFCPGAIIPPDFATCQTCLSELFDPKQRRFAYPFTHCTDCGPRYSLIEHMPFDRANTTMKNFTLCQHCNQEYVDANDRRFHAQTIACEECGPMLSLIDAKGETINLTQAELVMQTAMLLQAGKTIAIKGTSGVHLCCSAINETSISVLRKRKNRAVKPLAVMMADISQAEEYFDLSKTDKHLLTSPEAPIVLLDKAKMKISLPDLLAPGVSDIGVMLAYSPLHSLLLKQISHPLIMTSGNHRGAPVCISNNEAQEQLKDVADAFLLHNRKIVHRCDDSLLKLISGKPRLIRRARGYVPHSISLPDTMDCNNSILAIGGDLKNCFCLNKGNQAFLSAHNGDLSHPDCDIELQSSIHKMVDLLQCKPDIIAIDAHPDYYASRLGQELANTFDARLVQVQHHHAHLASCLVENQVPGDAKVLGIMLDGLGYGDDGNLWGGEFLLADYVDYKRPGHLKPFPLLGGEQANRQPWRNLLALCHQADALPDLYDLVKQTTTLSQLSTPQANALVRLSDKFPLCSSTGRLFDAVAALLDIAPETLSYEGEAAAKLEALALQYQGDLTDSPMLHFDITCENGRWILDPKPLWAKLIESLIKRESKAKLAMAFHCALAAGLMEIVAKLAVMPQRKFTAVALSGGVFQNEILLSNMESTLRQNGFKVYSQSKVPSNDGGIALGQLAIALSKMQHVQHEQYEQYLCA